MKKLFLLSIALFLSHSATADTRYTLLVMGNKAGYETSTTGPNGELQLYYEFNDRGRGPKITEKIVLGQRGIPTLIENSGNDYMKAPVVEKFSVANGTASWKNRAEEGQKAAAGKAFYISLSGVPEESALLAKALLASGGKLPLLPAGEASIEKRSELKITADGKTRTVTLYAITGLDFTPTPIWFDSDGNFYSISGWFSIVPEGWESAADPMLKAQQEFETQRSAQLAKALAHKPRGTYAIVHANLFDSTSATLKKNVTVLISGNRISAVEDGETATVPPGIKEVFEARGMTLMPGLWDCHVHLGPNDGLLHMAAGVTSVRDMANDIDQLAALQSRFDNGTEIGPRVLKAGFLDGRGPYAGPTKVFADTEEEARQDIDRYAKLGYVQTKIYSSIKPELVPKIAQMSHAHGMRVSGHVPAFMTAQQFIEDGADEIQHMNFIFLNFMFDQVKDTRTPARFTEVAQRGADIDPASPQVQGFIKLMLDHKTDLDPTLNVFEGMFTDRPGKVSASYAAVADRLPVQVRRGFYYGGIEVPSGMDQRYQDSFTQMLKMTKALYDAGVPIVAGTDALSGFALHRELELYEKAGIPAPKVLQLATLGAAHIMKKDDDLGSITPGKLADLIVVDGDPTTHISDIRKVKIVIKDGVVYKTADLYRAVGVQP
jgi:cytosine/adenosine deaminase-related metal-dependent hydrolase